VQKGAGVIVGYEFPEADPCPACQWLAGREPWAPVIQTELATSYVASRQRTHGTVCVIPKRHVLRLAEFTTRELTEVSQILRDVVTGIERAYAPVALHTWISTGSLASQHRPHAHINVVPRRAGEPYTFEASFGLDRVPVAQREQIASEIRDGLKAARRPG
jgi:diadenosine tetraphosphate (Ap4A) HIT family hydrolase